jgi:hypothetical protein
MCTLDNLNLHIDREEGKEYTGETCLLMSPNNVLYTYGGGVNRLRVRSY